MADIDWDFVFDGVVGFLTSPIWQLPVMNFIEKHCIVFDPSEENCLPWGDIHREYNKLVEDLLSSYLKDVGIAEEQFVHACNAPSMQSRPQLQVVFEQIWAAEDFEIFKRIMVQRNIELELQALQLIKQQQQQNENQRQKMTQSSPAKGHKSKGSVLGSCEDEILKEVMRQSKEEYETSTCKKGEEELGRHYVDSHEDNVKILQEKALEKQEEMKKFVSERVNHTKEAVGSSKERTLTEEAPAVRGVTSEKKSFAEKNAMPTKPSEEKHANSGDASRTWLLNAKEELACGNQEQLPSSSTSDEKEDLKRREQYLKDQRDRLLQMKSKERKKQLDDYSASQPKRPTSARTARNAVTRATNQSDDFEVDPSKLAVRKALADKLKKEVIYK